MVVARKVIGFDGTIIKGNQIAQSSASFGVTAGQVAGSGWYGNGCVCINAGDIIVAENVIVNSQFSGIRLGSCFNSQVVKNQIYNAGEIALMWECPVPAPAGILGNNNPDRFEGGCISNNVVINGGIGISVTNGYNGGRRVTILGNHVKTVSRMTVTTNDPVFPQYFTAGAGIVAECDCVVSGNIVESCAGPGIALLSQAFSNGSTLKSADVVAGNVVKSRPIGIGFYKESATGNSMIANNLLEGYTNGAIVPITFPAPYNTYTRVPGSTDYGTTSGGLFTGKPFSNVMIGLNFAI